MGPGDFFSLVSCYKCRGATASYSTNLFHCISLQRRNSLYGWWAWEKVKLSVSALFSFLFGDLPSLREHTPHFAPWWNAQGRPRQLAGPAVTNGEAKSDSGRHTGESIVAVFISCVLQVQPTPQQTHRWCFYFHLPDSYISISLFLNSRVLGGILFLTHFWPPLSPTSGNEEDQKPNILRIQSNVVGLNLLSSIKSWFCCLAFNRFVSWNQYTFACGQTTSLHAHRPLTESHRTPSAFIVSVLKVFPPNGKPLSQFLHTYIWPIHSSRTSSNFMKSIAASEAGSVYRSPTQQSPPLSIFP